MDANAKKYVWKIVAFIGLMGLALSVPLHAQLNVGKVISNVSLNGSPVPVPVPGATIVYGLNCNNISTNESFTNVIYDRINPNTAFSTNIPMMYNPSNWLAPQFSTNTVPDQSELSPDYSALPSPAVKWIRWLRTTGSWPSMLPPSVITYGVTVDGVNKTNIAAGTVLTQRTFARGSIMPVIFSNVVPGMIVGSNFGGRFITIATDRMNVPLLTAIKLTNKFKNMGNHSDVFALKILMTNQSSPTQPIYFSAQFRDSTDTSNISSLPLAAKGSNIFILKVIISNGTSPNYVQIKIGAQAKNGLDVFSTNYIGDNGRSYGGDIGRYSGHGIVMWKTNAPVGSKQNDGWIRFTLGDVTPPSQVRLLNPTNKDYILTTTPMMKWTKSVDTGSGVTNYKIYWSTNAALSSGVFSNNLLSANTTNWTMVTPLSNAKYYWRVRAFDKAGNIGVMSGISNFTVDTRVPMQVRLLNPTNKDYVLTTTPTMKFTKSADTGSGVTNYKIYWSTNAAMTAVVFSNTLLSANTTNWTMVLPLSNAKYYWRVKASDRAGNIGTYSGISNFIVDTKVPSMVVPVSPKHKGYSTTTLPALKWLKSMDTGSGVTNYKVYWSVNASLSNAVSSNNLLGANTTNWSMVSALSNVKYYWRVRAFDKAGNIGIYSGISNFTVDSVAPAAPTLLSPVASAFVSATTPTLVWTKMADLNRTNYLIYIDGTVRTNIWSVTNFTTSVLTNGVHTWRVKARDKAGLTNTSASWTFTVDTTAPTAPVLVTPVNAAFLVTTTPTLVWNRSTDASGITNYLVVVDAVTNVVVTTNYTTAALTQGSHTWQVCAKDKTLTLGALSGARTFTVDTVAPTTPTLSTPANGAYSQDMTPMFVWSKATDATTGVTNYQIVIDITTNILGLTNYTSGALADGVHTWKVRAKDNANNWGTYSSVWVITIDTTFPSAFAASSPGDGSFTADNTPTFVWTKPIDANLTNYRLVVNGVVVATLNWNQTNWTSGVLGDSAYAWSVVAVDKAGNTNATAQWTVNVSTGLPALPSLIMPVPGLFTTDNTVDLRWTRSSAPTATNYDVIMNGAVVSTTTHPVTNWTTGILVDGTYAWRVRVWDKAGLTNTTASWTFTVDTTAPTAPVLASPANGANLRTTTPMFVWNRSTDVNMTNYTIYVDGNPTVVGVTNWTSGALGQGAHTWRVKAVDKAGMTNSSASWTFTVDTIAPAMVTLVSPISNSAISVGSAVLTWNATSDATTGVAGYIVSRANNSGFAGPTTKSTNATSWAVTGLVSGMTNWWRVRAYDNIGNTNAWSSAWKFAVETNQIVPVLHRPFNAMITNMSTPAFVWNSNPGVSRYTIEVRTNNIAGAVKYSDTNAISTNRTFGALGDGLYVWRVRAFKTSTSQWQVWSGANSITIDLTAPSIPALSNPTNGFVTALPLVNFDWLSSTDMNSVSGYQLVINTLTNWVVGTSFTQGGLPNAVYTWKVRAKDITGNWSGYSGAWTLTVNTSITPDTPTWIIPTAVSTNAISLMWENVPNETSYTLYRSTSNDTNTVSTIFGMTVDQISNMDAFLTPNTTYYYFVKAFNAGIGSAFSPSGQATTFMNTDLTPPGEVSSLSAVASNVGNALMLYWINPGDGDFSFVKVIRKIGNTPANVSDGVTVYSNIGSAFSDAGLVDGTQYFYKAFTFDLTGNQSVGAWTSGIPSDSLFPGLVSSVTVTTNPLGNELSLSWVNPSDSDLAGVAIVRKIGSAPANIGDGLMIFNALATSFTDTGLVNGTLYYYALLTRDENNSNWISMVAVSGTPQMSAVPQAFGGVTFTVVGQSNVSLIWGSSVNASGYKVFRNTVDNSGTASVVFQTVGLSASLTGMVANTTYYFWIKATNSAGSTSFGSALSNTTLPSKAKLGSSRPASLNFTNTGFVFTNKNPVGAGGVSIYRYVWNNTPVTIVTPSDTIWDPGLSSTLTQTPGEGDWYLHIVGVNSAGALSAQTHLGPFMYHSSKPALFSLIVDKNRIEANGTETAVVNNFMPVLEYYTAVNVADGTKFMVETRDGNCVLGGVGITNGIAYVSSTNGNFHFTVSGTAINHVTLYVYWDQQYAAGSEIGLLISPALNIKKEDDAVVFDTIVKPGDDKARFFINSKKTERVRVQIYNMKSVKVREWDISGDELQYLEWDLKDGKGQSLPDGLYGVIIKGNDWEKKLKVYVSGWYK